MIWLVSDNIVITYEELIELVNNAKVNNFFCSFIADIVSNKDIDLSSYVLNTDNNNIKDLKDLKERFLNTKSKIIMKTSGTTGEPKVTKHKVADLLDNTRESLTPKVWLFTYNKYHMGGIQVLLQAFRNGSMIVDAYKKDRKNILNSILKYQVTNISATPTFYRMLLPIDKKYHSVNRVTLGGERVDGNTIGFIKMMFPSAKINNIYATTETGAVLFSKDDRFRINDKVLIKDGILHIIMQDKAVHCTGDMVEVHEDGYFLFSGRNSSIINVGGNNVNPYEIEDVLKEHPFVKEAVVYGKKNRLLGNVLCCDIVLLQGLTQQDIKKYLEKNIEEGYKIPRIIKIKNSIKISETNKAIR
tara:strand:+ start:1140 stop:2213 length:1074 start_codon:yes stop_codon:yes gene_type:complete